MKLSDLNLEYSFRISKDDLKEILGNRVPYHIQGHKAYKLKKAFNNYLYGVRV